MDPTCWVYFLTLASVKIMVRSVAKCMSEFPLVSKSGGPGTSSSMKLEVLFAFQGSPDYYQSFVFFFRVSLSYVVCSHNYIFSRLTKLALLYKTHFSNFYFYILVILSLCFGYFPMGWFDICRVHINTSSVPHLCSYIIWDLKAWVKYCNRENQLKEGNLMIM